jgi:F420-non-reducing hydrogenase small subunit
MTASVGPGPREPGKLRVGMYWASSCGGCDISLLEIAEHLLELIEKADIVFWPCVTDFKYQTVAGYPDGYIDVCLFNGAIRSSEQEEIARLLRPKSRMLVAYGACAMDGGIPALANLKSRDEIYDASYHASPTVQNPGRTEPREHWAGPEGGLTLPRFYAQVLRLADIVHVDYQLPGCPPVGTQVWRTLQALMAGEIPADGRGARVGCDARSVCDECHREKRKTRIAEFKRPHLAIPEPNWCLLEQGFVCVGPATRSGCGALCTTADLPCRGCYGTAGEATDAGTAMLSAIGSILDATTEARALELVEQIVDPTGTFYRFGLASSHLKAHR